MSVTRSGFPELKPHRGAHVMEVPFATNFNEYVALRQVVGPRNRRAMEEAGSLDRALGSGFADCIRRLRLLRNQVAHEPIYHQSSEDATGYARHAFTLIAALGRRVSRLEGIHDRTGNPTLEGNHNRK